jgi:putative membrane protein
MSNWWAHAFPFFKALHIVAIISWMAGLLYLPRLFVYHCEAEAGSKMSETFKLMEARLSRVIMFPAMLASLTFGFALLLTPAGYAALTTGWLWAKLGLVLLLLTAHRQMLVWRDDFAADRNLRRQRFFRIANEVPTLLMLGIVLLVVIRPF